MSSALRTKKEARLTTYVTAMSSTLWKEKKSTYGHELCFVDGLNFSDVISFAFDVEFQPFYFFIELLVSRIQFRQHPIVIRNVVRHYFLFLLFLFSFYRNLFRYFFLDQSPLFLPDIFSRKSFIRITL